MWFDDDDDDYEKWNGPHGARHAKKLSLPADVHLPNKNEAKELRKIKQQTGLSVKEIRSIKKYRVQLSQAQKSKGSNTEKDRKMISIIKSVTKELQLPKEHPTVIDAILNKIDIYNSNTFRGYSEVLSISKQNLIEFMKKMDKKKNGKAKANKGTKTRA